MADVDRIVFSGDILRPFPDGDGGWQSATVKNVRWLGHLLGWQLARATALPQESVTWTPGGFDPRPVYEACGLSLDPDGWASLFYRDALPEAAASRLVAPFRGALVIGIELPEVLLEVLGRAGIPYVDLVAHPARFADDILIALRTNVDSVHRELVAHEADLDRFTPFANLHRAKTAWMPPLPLPEGTALITGQVATDKAVICRRTGRFLNLGDYVERLFEICEKHPQVLFKPHPYQGPDCPSLRVIRSFASIQTVDENFYYLMGQDAITDVYAISSGTVHEAPFFGKTGHALGDPLYEFGTRAPRAGRSGACVPLVDAYFHPSFWARALEGRVAVGGDLPPGPDFRASRLRRSLNADWDHAYIDAVVQTPRDLAAFTPRPEMARR